MQEPRGGDGKRGVGPPPNLKAASAEALQRRLWRRMEHCIELLWIRTRTGALSLSCGCVYSEGMPPPQWARGILRGRKRLGVCVTLLPWMHLSIRGTVPSHDAEALVMLMGESCYTITAQYKSEEKKFIKRDNMQTNHSVYSIQLECIFFFFFF